MKKLTLSALAVLVASSAQAYTLFDNTKGADFGTKLETDGDWRIAWRSTSDRTTTLGDNSRVTKKHENLPVANNGSRFGLRLTQELGNDFYAVGRIQWRFNSLASSKHDFDHPYSHYAFGGLGHKKYGELVYGNILSLGDEVRQTDLPNTLSISDGLLPSTVRNAAQYTYSGIEGLKLGVLYGGYTHSNSKHTRLADPRKNILALNAIYTYKFDDVQKLTFGLGFARERFKNASDYDSTYSRNSYAFDTAYTYANTILAVDLEQRITNDKAALNATAKDKITEREVRTLVYQKLNDSWRVYAQYGYKTKKTERSNVGLAKVKTNQYMFGSEYRILAKQEILPAFLKEAKVFVEYQIDNKKEYGTFANNRKVRDNKTVIGFRFKY